MFLSAVPKSFTKLRAALWPALALVPPCRYTSSVSSDKIVVTAALNGVLTDPVKFNIPVTPVDMAIAAEQAYNAGAAAVHIHIRDQRPGKGHLPSWDPAVAAAVVAAIRARVPNLIINMTTGTIGSTGPAAGGALGPTGGPIACLASTSPDMAALNAGSLNYLKTKKDGTWAWPPMLFDNTVEKVQTMVQYMNENNILPECECFDTGIVRSVGMFEDVGMLRQPVFVSLVMGVASGMPADPDWLPLLKRLLKPKTQFQVIAIGREDEVWPLLRRCSELGGNVRTGLEDTMYLPSGVRAASSGELIDALVTTVRATGREPATIDEARAIFGTKPRA